VARDVIHGLSPVERRLGLAFTTLTIFAPLAQASHPKQAIQAEGTAAPLEFVATAPSPRGITFARQVLPARVSAHATTERAQSRVIYLNHDGALLTQRLGTRTTTTDSDSPTEDGSDDGGPTIRSPGIGGCAVANGGAGIAMALAMLGVCLRRRR
jgi:hypothetical protein